MMNTTNFEVTLETACKLSLNDIAVLINDGAVTGFESLSSENGELTISQVAVILDNLSEEDRLQFLNTRSLAELSELYEVYGYAAEIENGQISASFVEPARVLEIEESFFPEQA